MTDQSTSTREQHWHIGLTWLIPPVRLGRLITGFALFFSLVVLFAAAGVLQPDGPPALAESRLAAVFFSVLIAYIVPMFHFISERTIRALDEIADRSTGSASTDGLHDLVAYARQRVLHKPRGWMISVLALGLTCAVLHNAALMGIGNLADIVPNAWVAMILGTTLTWLVLMLVLASLMDNALNLRRIAARIPINPLQPASVRPIARVAVASTLAVVGAQAAFPLLMIDATASAIASVPGLVATAVPMVTLALLPVWPLHARLRDARQQLLDAIDRQLDALGAVAPDNPTTVEALLAQLAYRREVRAASTWPVDLSIAARLAFYITIPPLTWVAAALIERLVDHMI